MLKREPVNPGTGKETVGEWPGRAWRGRVDVDQSIYSRDLVRSELNIIRHARHTAGGGWSNPSPIDDGFIVTSCLRPTHLAEVQAEGKVAAASVSVPETGLLIYSLKSSYTVHIPEAFDAVSFRVSQSALDAKARELGHSGAPDLSEPFLSGRDEVMYHLSKALLPALERPAETNSLFADHVFNAVVLHLVGTVGGLRQRRAPLPGRLSPRQERLAMELLQSDFRRELSLAELAAACDLSVGHFARAFRNSTGLPPHQWRLQRIIERTKSLLDQPNIAISDIALACGFADQSHFTRVFRRMVGTSPAAWRRDRLG
ncbi:MAG TPA: AraC family transcriptional regulator [Bordetella sp.]|nr:AraC family transcriptional regulator [Bordetella sp.]